MWPLGAKMKLRRAERSELSGAPFDNLKASAVSSASYKAEALRLALLVFLALGCLGPRLPEKYRPFFRLPRDTQPAEIRTRPVEEQLDLYVAGVTGVHPPRRDLGLVIGERARRLCQLSWRACDAPPGGTSRPTWPGPWLGCRAQPELPIAYERRWARCALRWLQYDLPVRRTWLNTS